MTDETKVASPEGAVPESAPPAAPVAAVAGESAPRAEGEQSKPAAPPSGDPPPPAKPPEPPQWMKDRLAKKTAETAAMKMELAKLQARLQEAEAHKGGAKQQFLKPDGTPLSPADIRELAHAEAQQIAWRQNFDKACNDAAAEGEKRFGPDFKARVGALAGMVDWSDQASVTTYNRFLETALETGDAPKIIHALGADPDEAARVMAMPPVKQAVALAKLAAAKGAPEPSSAPKPIKPLGTRSAPAGIAPDDPEHGAAIPMSEWVSRRNAQVTERRKAG